MIFDVVNPVTGELRDIQSDLPFQGPGASLTIDTGWDSRADFINTGSVNSDLAYRTSGSEASVDFKRTIHAIHTGEFRETPFVVIGFNGSVHGFSHVRFPAKLRNCLNCHVEIDGRGTFELPLDPAVLGSTVDTGSVYEVDVGAERTISVDPSDDLKISPTAATCSACHDKDEVRSPMVRRGGASFATLQENIGVTVNERCADCHGPGKGRDVRKAHEIRSGDRDRRDDDDHEERDGDREREHD